MSDTDKDTIAQVFITFCSEKKCQCASTKESNALRACRTNPSSQMILSGKIEASGEGGRDGVQLD